MGTSPPMEPKTPNSEWHDAFQEPHTLPGGWDLSEILTTPRPPRAPDGEGGGEVRNAYGAAQNPA